MDFYQELSRHYDEIFAADAAEMGFINQLVPAGAAILDIGCGTGNKTVYLSERASSIDAVDLDQGMINAAKNAHARPNISYFALDMRAIDKAFAGRKFDAALCLGNTLVHLLSLEAILDLLRKVQALLANNGVFILQILNYDRIIADNITELPPIETPNIRFLRRYIWKDGVIRFSTTLEIKNKGEMLLNDIPLYPLVKQGLSELLSKAGFARVEFFGGYQGEEHKSDSFLTVALCHKA